MLPIVTLTTDFGAHDSYVGQLKGAALAIEPSLRIVDLCHDVPAHDIAAGAYVLETAFGAFPEGTVHVAVVDPGVGSSRRPLVAVTDRYVFIAPDNGLLGRVLELEPSRAVHVLSEPRYRRSAVSATFEGRDVFAPAAAWIARGTRLDRFGPAAGPIVDRPFPRPELRRGTRARLRVVWVDHFGNVVIDVRRSELAEALGREPRTDDDLHVETPFGTVGRFRRTYADGVDGDPFLLINSSGYLEIALDTDRADRLLRLRSGDTVELGLRA